MSNDPHKHPHPDPELDEARARAATTGGGPVTGTAAAGAAIAGAAMGSLAGPIGSAVGAAVGAVAGGLAGKAIADAIDPAAEHAHWREHHTREAYYRDGYGYEDYGPAYELGWRDAHKHGDKAFDDVEDSLAHEWDIYRGKSRLDWPEASSAARAAWERAQRGRMAVCSGRAPARASGIARHGGDPAQGRHVRGVRRNSPARGSNQSSRAALAWSGWSANTPSTPSP